MSLFGAVKAAKSGLTPWGFALWLIGGWRALGFAVCALVLFLNVQRWQNTAEAAQASLRLARADVAVLEAQRDAANAIAADMTARAEAAVAAEQAERAARQAEAKARARKWDRINQDEKAWAEVEVPARVWEGLGK